MRRCVLVGLFVGVLGFMAPRASAQRAMSTSTESVLDRGVAEYEDLRFQEALQSFSAALVRPGLVDADRARVYRYLALTYLALERREEAEGAYRSLLGLMPETQPGSDLSPRFREFFAGVRSRWEADGRPGLPPPAPVSIRHRSPPQAVRGEAVTLAAELEDPDHRVQQLVLAYRQGTDAIFERLPCARQEDGSFAVTLPSAAIAPPLVEYYLEALDQGGLPISSRGDVAAPLRIAVPAPSGGGDLTAEPLFWVAVIGGAAVVAGGVVLGVVLANGNQQGTLVFTIDD